MKPITAAKCLAIMTCLLVSISVFGQSKVSGGVTGVVKDASAGTADGVPYAVVSIPRIGVSTVTDAEGHYSIRNLEAGEYEVVASSLGYENVTGTVKVGKTLAVLDLEMKQADFHLDQVVVTATASKAGAATASNISRTAIEHIQANSLADVMTLLPGADITSSDFKPDLQGVKNMSIRGGQAMGTAVILDGAPISNSANMQTMSAAIGGSSPGAGGVTPSSGVDLRTITTDNIESVEVIRGVASVEYGNATAGTVIVNAKAGKEPMTLRFNTNPNIYSIGLTHGTGLGANKGFLNYGVDYAYSVKEPREGYDYFQRATARVAYSNNFGKLNSTTSAAFTWTKDKGEPNPDDANDYQTKNSRSTGIRLATNGTYDVSAGWFKNVKYNLTFNYTDRLSYFSDKATNGDVAYSYSKVDGSVLSSRPGMHVYDVDGNEITKFGDDLAGSRSWITPASYQYEYNVYGKELNTFAKVVANFAGKIGSTSHHIIVGADFTNDGNVGKGKVFDYDVPPFRNVSYTYATQRERAYKDIPFLNKLGVYAEESFHADIFKRELEIVAGVRYDKVFGVSKGAFAPRINASYEIIPDVLSIRGAYGVSVMSPALAYVYPDNAYFDMINFNNSLSTTVPDAQKFQVITTHVYDTRNSELELARHNKSEVGLDLKLGQVRLALTAYNDFCGNGYSYTKGLDCLRYVDFTQYKADSYNPDGVTIPALSVDETKSGKYFLQYTKPSNNLSYKRSGLEFVLDFGRIDAIRTSFMVNGEYYKYSSWNNGYLYYNKSGVFNQNVGIYSQKISSGIDHDSNCITNFIATHNIPQLGFVISVTANVNWCYKSWTEYGIDDDIPVKYLSIADGKVYDFNRANANPESESYSQWLPILRNEANGAISPDRREIEPAYRPVLCINTNVTKQFNRFSVSFFANNVFRSTPLQPLVKNPGSFVRRNADTFFFGLQLTAKIF